MIKVLLTKLSSSHQNLRTNSIEGVTTKLPEEGDTHFMLLGEGLEFGTRMVRTTEIKQVTRVSETQVEFRTLNSHYKLEVLSSEEVA